MATLDTPPNTAEAIRPRRRDAPPAADQAASQHPPLTPGAVLGILRRHQWLLLASIVLIPLAAAIALHVSTPLYTATGTLLYDPPAYRLAELQSILRADPITEDVMASQAEVLRSLKIAERVATQLNLFDNPAFNPALRRPPLPVRALRRIVGWLGHAPATETPRQRPDAGAGPGPRVTSGPRTTPRTDTAPDGRTGADRGDRPGTGSSDIPGGVGGGTVAGPRIDDARNAVLLAVQQAIGTTTVRASRVITVTFTAPDRVLAAAAVNMVMDIYIKDGLGAKYRAVRKADEWLDARVAELRAQVRGDEDRIAAYRASHGMIQGMHAGLDAEQVSHLSEDLETARADMAAAQARLDAARGKAGAAALAAIAPSVVPLRAQADSLRAQLQGLNGRLGPNHPDVLNLRRQIADTDRAVAAETARVVAATEADARAATERVAALEADLRTARQAVDSTAQAQIPLDGMQREADAGRALLQAVLGSIQQTAQQAAVESPDAHELSLALPPTTPSSPRVVQIMAGATAFGLMFGLLLVYIAEVTDRSLRSGAEVRAALGLPCFALIPEVPARHLGHMPIPPMPR